jgi:hypothetical protein
MTLGSRSCAPALLLTALSLGWCLHAAPALAEEPDAGTRVAARELAVSGAEAFDKGDFATALDRFLRAEALYKVPSISVMVARSFAGVGRVVEAVDKYEETLRVPLDAAAPEAFQRAVAEATAEVEAVRARVSRLEVRLPANAPAGTVVTLDGKAVPAALLGVATPVNPGAHHLAARAPARAPYSFDLRLPEGGRQTVEISLEPASATPATAVAAPAAPPARRQRTSPLTIALLAGGGVAIVGGAVTGVAALSHKSSLDAACKPGCPSNMSADLSAFRRDRTLSYFGFGLGLAAAGAGTYLLFHQGASGNEVGALVLPGGAAVKGSF